MYVCSYHLQRKSKEINKCLEDTGLKCTSPKREDLTEKHSGSLKSVGLLSMTEPLSYSQQQGDVVPLHSAMI